MKEFLLSDIMDKSVSIVAGDNFWNILMVYSEHFTLVVGAGLCGWWQKQGTLNLKYNCQSVPSLPLLSGKLSVSRIFDSPPRESSELQTRPSYWGPPGGARGRWTESKSSSNFCRPDDDPGPGCCQLPGVGGISVESFLEWQEESQRKWRSGEPVKPEEQRNEGSVTKDNFRLSCLSE